MTYFKLEDGSEVDTIPLNYTGIVIDGWASVSLGIENRLTYFKSNLHCTQSFALELRKLKSGVCLQSYYLLNKVINKEATIIYIVD